MSRESDRWIGAVFAVKQALYRSVMVNRDLSQKASYSLIYISALICGHKLWSETKKIRSQRQAAEMGFLCRVFWLSLRDRMNSLVIQEELRSGAAASPGLEEPVEVTQAWLGWTPQWWGVQGTPHWEETQGKIQDTLVGRCFWTGLETPWDFPGGADLLPPATRSQMSRRRWMEGCFLFIYSSFRLFYNLFQYAWLVS